MIDDYTPPQDTPAEQAVIGIVLNKPAVFLEAGLTGAEFYQPRHEMIWRAMLDLIEKDQRPEPAAVLGRLIDKGQVDKIGGGVYLHELIALMPSPASLGYFVDRVVDKYRKRALIDSLTGALQDARSSEDPADDVVRRAESMIGRAAPSEAALEEVMTLQEFLDQPVPPEDWIIPDLLDRGDRLILTGSEGLGKSVLMRQMGMCVAAGMDPFSGKRIRPQTVLMIDCENPLKIMMKVFGNLQTSIRGHVGYDIPDNRFWIQRRPAGISLDKPSDRLWLKRLCVNVNPDLLCIGPTYKLYEGEGSHEEYAARRVTSAIDEIREEVGCAVIMEHHSPHGMGGMARTVRPIGSSAWLRWPEFGIGLRLVESHDEDEQRKIKERRLVDVVHWRGARDERSWPENLESGGATMPWVETVIDNRS